ncbi:hypothetical protein M4D48_03910 [Alkalihalobacillus clausii]|uniref:hypothetical protein n=1 Tax=Shouchella clausii TaxID=79880 RepID=UPI00203B52D3|nr:hypothetical protein [Shouchella clausii]MCM3547726.1 hypothetical protein [Shouchella clausii]
MRVAWLQQLQGLGRVPVLFKDKVLITIIRNRVVSLFTKKKMAHLYGTKHCLRVVI